VLLLLLLLLLLQGLGVSCLHLHQLLLLLPQQLLVHELLHVLLLQQWLLPAAQSSTAA
jgi:hypothetical protein